LEEVNYLVITDWIDACKRELGIKSDREFSRFTGISSGLLSKWRNGKCTPSTDSLKKMSEATGKDIGILFGYAAGSRPDSDTGPDTDSENRRSDGRSSVQLSETSSDRIRYIRVYRSEELRNDAIISSGYPVSDHDPEKSKYIILPDMYEPQDEYFAFSVPDNNMVPELYSGDTVIVHMQDDALDGDTVIACIGQDAAVCAILLNINEGMILNSPTRDPGPAFFSNVSIRDLPVRIIGKVVDLHHRDYK
jgi:SOS-response transcriptional repressor LexA